MGMEELKAQKAALDNVERKSEYGAFSRAPKEQLLDAADVQERHPDKKLRWVNIKDPQKAATRQMEGYVRLSPEEGGKQVGNELALMAIPKDRVDARVASQEQRNRDLMEAHHGEMNRAAEDVAKMLRDKYGVRISEKRILVDEG